MRTSAIALARSKVTAGVADPAAIGHENHRRNFKAFLDSLENNEPFRIPGPEARKAVQVILALYTSAREQKPVKLRP